MEVYIEYVILDNFIIDFLLLYATGKVLKKKLSKSRIIIACFLGCMFAVLSPFLSFGGITLILIKILMGAIIVFACFKIYKIKDYIISIFIFLFLTFLMGGACYAVLGNLQKFNVASLYCIYSGEIPISLIIVTLLFMVYMSINIYKYLSKKQRIDKFIYKAKFIYDNFTIEAKGYLDTGNHLIDTYSKKPVTIITKKCFEELFNCTYELKNLTKLKNFRFIKIKTVVKENSLMPTFDLTRLEIVFDNQKKVYDIMPIGISQSNLDFYECDCLISEELIQK